MLLSMTGYGENEQSLETGAVSVEVRTINSRHFKLSYRSSDGCNGFESRIEALVRKYVRRGTVQLNLGLKVDSKADQFRINPNVVDAYRRQILLLNTENLNQEQVRLDTLLTLPGVIEQQDKTSEDLESYWPTIEKTVSQALKSLTEMRTREGLSLTTDLTENCRLITTELNKISARTPHVVRYYRERITERVSNSLKDLDVTIEPSDLVREVALFTDRSDISEEIVRLKCHLEQFAEVLSQTETAGRKLEFLAQEMGREVNTIGSKANDPEISHAVVEIKASLERIREQLQNVE